LANEPAGDKRVTDSKVVSTWLKRLSVPNTP
jgi:hypothetical protein